MPAKKKEPVRFELHMDSRDKRRLADLAKRHETSAAAVIRMLVKREHDALFGEGKK